MKHLLALLLLTFAINSQAQYTYHPFPVDSAIWTYYSWGQYTSGPFWKSNRHIIIKNKDTTIKGTQYKVLFHRSARSLFYLPSSNNDTPISSISYYPDLPYGAIREDNKKIYAIRYSQSWDTVERVIYDFNLVAGDTLPAFVYVDNPWPPNNHATHYIIDHIDTVTLGGKTRKRFVAFGYDSGTLDYKDSAIVTEGIGSDKGLFYYNHFFRGGTRFRCHSAPGLFYGVDTPCVYTHEYGTPTSIPTTNTKVGTDIYPNPTIDKTTIEAPIGTHIIVYNSTGKIVATKTSKTTKETIDLQELPSGLYIINLYNEQLGIDQRKKIMKL
ncbi:MAG: T9SS type A sorting domain-containing protein [Flavipsychrobacter sp.]